MQMLSLFGIIMEKSILEDGTKKQCRKMEKVLSLSLTNFTTRANFSAIRDKDMGSWSYLMVYTMKDNGLKEKNMEEVNFKINQ